MVPEEPVAEMANPGREISTQRIDKTNVDRFLCLSSHHDIVADDNHKLIEVI